MLTIAFNEQLSILLTLAEKNQRLGEVKASAWWGETNLLNGGAGETQVSAPTVTNTILGPASRQTATAAFGSLRQTVHADRYTQWPEAAFLQWEFQNTSTTPLFIDRFECPSIHLHVWATRRSMDRSKGPWTFQGAAVNWGQDFAFELPRRFSRENFLGHNAHGEGGGIPLIYLWTSELGLALAHVESKPKDWYMPASSTPWEGMRMGLESRQPVQLGPGEIWRSLRVMVSVHHGDFFVPLAHYRQVMAMQGIQPAQPNPEDFEPAWCSWGYEFDITPSKMVGVLPATSELGLRWLTLDDRWFDNYGDWNPRPDTFPKGEAEMRAMVAKIHEAKAYAQIWWYPLAVEDGSGQYTSHRYIVASLLKEHPDWLILNPDSSPARNNRGLAMLCPALPGVQEYLRQMTHRFIHDWDFDGHKLDNIYTVPACHNPAHHHTRPEESTEALADAYRIIFEATRRLKPYSVTQICPCGTPPTFSLLPFMDQAVTADPTSSAQIRQRVKFYKALLGPQAAVFADHVELSDDSNDFASEIGVGGIPATKFVWPIDETIRTRVQGYWPLTAEKKSLLSRWLEIYQKNRLAEGEYLNLYDLAFDMPEAHAIRKGEQIYYAFYTPRREQTFRGKVTLRGLKAQPYSLKDYANDRELGTITGPEAEVRVRFEGSLLIMATPTEGSLA